MTRSRKLKRPNAQGLHFFYADEVTVFIFSDFPDALGMTFGLSSKIKIPRQVPVFFDSARGEKVGVAAVKRIQDTLCANMQLESTMESIPDAYAILGSLYPAARLTVTEVWEDSVIRFSLDSIVLTPVGNIDESIGPLAHNGLLRIGEEVLN